MTWYITQPPTRQDIENVQAELERAQRERQSREDRYAACEVDPSDCFLSEWANGLTIRLQHARADLVEKGLVQKHLALFDIETGKRLNAIMLRVPDRYSYVAGATKPMWKITQPDGSVVWSRVAFQPTPRQIANDAKKGFVQGSEYAPTWALIEGSGHGLSGQAWVATERFDEGLDPDSTLKENASKQKARAKRRAQAIIDGRES